MNPQSTDRIRFRPVEPGDADVLNALNHAPGVMRYLDHQPPTRETIENVIIPNKLRASRDNPGYGMWLAYLQQTEECIGWFALEPNHPRNGDAEIGYRLFPQYWGRGLATEGASRLMQYAFDQLGAERCVATTMAVNIASRKVMERSGLNHTRTFHEEFEHPLPGTEEGEVEYSLTREEWLLRRS